MKNFVKGTYFNQEKFQKILLIQLGDIGDVILTLPSISILHDNYPDSKIVVAVREKAKDLIRLHPLVNDVITIKKNKRSLFRQLAYQIRFFSTLRCFGFDLAIDFRTGTRGAVLSYLSGAPNRISFYATDGDLWRNRLFTGLLDCEYEPSEYVADYYANLLVAFLPGATIKPPQLKLTNKKIAEAEIFLEKQQIPLDKGIITIQPFSLWQYKEWSFDKFVKIIGWLQKKTSAMILITGGLDEKQKSLGITRSFEKGVYNLVGKTTLGQLAGILSISDLFIGVDSAGLHISAAVGTPTVSIFGPSSAISWAPKGDRHQIVTNKMDCVPCRQKGCDGTEKSLCLETLTVAEVKKVIETQLLLGNLVK